MIQSPNDSRDFPYVPVDRVLPSVDLRVDVGDLGVQGEQEACTGFSTRCACQIFARRNLDFNNLSAELPYYMGRLATGWQDQNVGANLREVLAFLKNRGNVYESEWPYAPYNQFNRPSDDTLNRIVGRISRYERLGMSGKGLAYEIKSALSEGLPVVVGMKIYSPFFRIRGSLLEQVQQRPYRGGVDAVGDLGVNHSLCIVGYSLEKIGVANWWGSQWGDNGFALLEGEVVNDIFEAWVVRGFAKDGADLTTISAWLATKTDYDIERMFDKMVLDNPRWWAIYGFVKRNGGGKPGFVKMAQIVGFTKMYELNNWVATL